MALVFNGFGWPNWGKIKATELIESRGVKLIVIDLAFPIKHSVFIMHNYFIMSIGLFPSR